MAEPSHYVAGRYGMALWLLSTLFLGRVVGQILVAFAGVAWLPPMREWYSGLLPYPLLLPTQILILAAMWRVNRGVHTGTGWLWTRRPRAGKALVAFAALYVAVMVVRYVVFGAMYPERRWYPPGIIPIVFHFVLATYLFLLGRLTLRHGRPAAPSA
jgi:hypothetical protein